MTMHGQVKIRLPNDKEVKQLELDERDSREFSILTEEIVRKRKEGILGVNLLKKIAALLEKVPDMFTLWNYRREILLNLNTDFSDISHSRIYDDELYLTSKCLLSHPKSYSTWHHRYWVMLHHPSPNWKSELDLCNICLNSDDRNFHCWDYRRFVVKHAQISSTKELEFSEKSIEINFSNYSAWHYRSQILGFEDSVCTVATPVSPPPGLDGRSQENTNLSWNELDLLHNAIFSDPMDEAPWLYYWWLLGRGESNSYLRELYISRTLQRVILVFTAPKLSSAISHLHVSVIISNPSSIQTDEYSPIDFGGWRSALNDSVSAVWWFELPKELIEARIVSVTVYTEEAERASVDTFNDSHDSHVWLYCQMQRDQCESLTRVELDPRRLLNPIVSAIHEPLSLKNELDTVRELVSMGPNNKWALLTLVSLLRYIRAEESKEEITNSLKTLCSFDSLRTRYYNDMASAHTTEDALINAYLTNSRTLNLSNSKLTRICCLDWCSLMTTIDFSNNNLDHLPGTFAYLLCLEYLNLDDNTISSLKPITGLPLLSRISICRNCIATFEGLEPALSCPRLHDLAIIGNAVAELHNFTQLLSGHPESTQSHRSLNVIYNRPVRT